MLLIRLKLKKAIPILIDELNKTEDWELWNNRYGCHAALIVDTIEQLTGVHFLIQGEARVQKEPTLKNVNDWWAKQDPKDYE